MKPAKKKSTPQKKNVTTIRGDVTGGVVFAGDNNIVNYFTGEYVSLKEHYIPPDSVFQRVRTEDFVGRDWLTAQVDAFLNDPQRKSGAFLLIGDAGVGKTSFMAHLVKERRYLHLFAEQAPGQAMLQRAIQSLGSQLVTRYQIDPYKDRDTLIQGTVFPDFLERLLRMAASKLTGGEKIVIVCDALDEAGTFPDGNVFGLPNVLPDGVYLILSQRPVNVKVPNLEPLTVRLEAQGADNLQDMEKYLGVVAQRASVADQLRAKNYSDAFFIQTLKEKSLGVWMYLHYVIKEIEQGSRAPLELAELPTGLVGYYADFWGDWRMGRKGRGEGEKAWNALYAPLLTTLAAAQEAITIGTLMQWAEVNADEDEVARLVAEEWRAFIEEKEVGAEKRYKPYHLSFADFIAGRADGEKLPPAQKNLVRDLAKRTVKAHHRIVKVFEAECHGQWEKLVEQEYPRLHLSAHLNGAGEYETLRILLTEGDEKIKWAEAREKKEETYAGYLKDLSYVWAYAERKQNYALAIRCMLIENSIHSLAANIPPELLAELAKAGIWSYARCLEVIRQKIDDWQKAESLELLAPEIPPLLHKEVLSIINEIEINKGDYEKINIALSALAPYLSEELKKQTLDIACDIEDENLKAITLSALVSHLSNELEMQAFSIAREIKGDFTRANALSTLAPFLSEKLKLQALQEALTFAQKIEGEESFIMWNLAQNLIGELKTQTFPSHLNDELMSQVLQDILFIARKIQDETVQASALTIASLHMGEKFKSQIFQEALAAIRKVEGVSRVSILSYLVPHLDNKSKVQVLQEAFAAACEIEEEFSRAEALAVLAPYLDKQLKRQALTIAREIKEERYRAEVVTALAPHLDNKSKVQVLQEALATAHKVEDEIERIAIFSILIPHLSTRLRSQALQIALTLAHEIKDDHSRAHAMFSIWSYLNNDLKKKVLQEMLSIAYGEKENRIRANVLISLVPHLDDELNKQVIQDALSAMRDDELFLALALGSLAPYLNNKLKRQVLTIAYEIKDASNRVGALSALIPYLSNALRAHVLKKALSALRELEYDGDAITERTIALSLIIPHLTDDIKSHMLQEALSIARKIKDKSNRAYTLSVLAPHLNEELNLQALQETLSAEQDFDEREFTKVLSNLAPYINKETQIRVLQGILYICKVDRSYWDIELNQILNVWRKIKFEGLEKYVIPFIVSVSQKDRKYGIQIIGIFTPALVHFGGEEIVPELYRAIQDTARWWP